MPHLTTEVRLSPGPVIYPIVGNTGNGGAVYDGNGEALYAALVDGQFQVWRTRDGYLSLLRYDGSVDYLATIAAGPFIEPATAALQRINGTIYAHLTGKNMGALTAGGWIYRDTSAAADGTGPWVFHGTVMESAISAGQTAHLQGGWSGGEIVVSGSLWVTNFVRFSAWDGSTTQATYGVATSSDGGVTWAERFHDDFSYVGSNRGLTWSRNFAQYGGTWHVGGWGYGVSTSGKHYKSPDLTNWTLWEDAGANADYPLSTPSALYRINRTESTQVLEATTNPPDANLWVGTEIASLVIGDTFPHIANIGHDTRPIFAAFNKGTTMRITVALTVAPPCRQYPREDGLATSSATRIFPQPRSQQGGLRQGGGTYY